MKTSLLKTALFATVVSAVGISAYADQEQSTKSKYFTDSGMGFSYLIHAECEKVDSVITYDYSRTLPADTVVKKEADGFERITSQVFYSIPMEANVENFKDTKIDVFIKNAYDTLYHDDGTSTFLADAKTAPMVRKGVSGSVVGALSTNRAGEFYWGASMFEGKQQTGHIQITSDPLSTFGAMSGDTCKQITMHGAIKFVAVVKSGYPYDYTEYQNKSVSLEILDMNNNKVKEYTAELNASADSTKLEYVCNQSWTQIPNEWPEFTMVFHKANGDTLMRKVYSQPYFLKLNHAIDTCQIKMNLIKDSVQYAAVYNELDSAVNAAKPFLKYTAYEQNAIDDAASSLEDTFNKACEEIEQIRKSTGIKAVTSDQQDNSRKTSKMLEKGRIVLTVGNKRYTAIGQQIK